MRRIGPEEGYLFSMAEPRLLRRALPGQFAVCESVFLRLGFGRPWLKPGALGHDDGALPAKGFFS